MLHRICSPLKTPTFRIIHRRNAPVTNLNQSVRVLSTTSTTLSQTTPAPSELADGKVAYASKSNLDLIRGMLVLLSCHEAIVKHADRLIHWSRTILGTTVTNAVIRATFFKHFCAGETQEEALRTMQLLRKFGVGGILDFAAEGDVSQTKIPTRPPLSREYEYESEKVCDDHLKDFETCIAAAGKGGFAAVKVTALGDAETIRRISHCVTEIRALFGRLQNDSEAQGVLNKERFYKIFSRHFRGGPDEATALYDSIMNTARARFFNDVESSDDEIDVWEWLSYVTPRAFVNLSKTLKNPPTHFQWTMEDSEKMERMAKRLDLIAKKASEQGVRIMVDAEQTYFQPAIDALTLDLQRKHNSSSSSSGPIVFSTYQAYLKDAKDRLQFALNASKREKWTFACKIVRGAYMVRERSLAIEESRPSPVHDTLADTAHSYRECCEMVLRHNPKAELVVASHNRVSVGEILETMKQLGRPIGSVSFAQLYGMADAVSFGLAAEGHPVFKYLPFGPVNEVVPYLVRRAQENSSVAAGAQAEFALMSRELKRRLFG